MVLFFIWWGSEGVRVSTTFFSGKLNQFFSVPTNPKPLNYEPPSSQPHCSLCSCCFWEKDDDVGEIGKWNQIGILAHRQNLLQWGNAVHPTHHHIPLHRPVHENATDQPDTGISQGQPETPSSNLTPSPPLEPKDGVKNRRQEMSDKMRNES